MFAKINTDNGMIEYAPEVYILEDGRIITNFYKNEKLMKRYGFKEVIENFPDNKDNEEMIIKGYEDIGDNIVITYVLKHPYDDFSLKEYKMKKINESKENLAQYLFDHPIVSKAHNKDGGVYGVTIDHQNRLASNIMTYTLAQQAGVEGYITWNETGKPCEIWSIEEASQLALEMKMYVTPMISLQQHMEVDIDNCKRRDSVEKVNIEFTEEIVEAYRQQFNSMLEG